MTSRTDRASKEPPEEVPEPKRCWATGDPAYLAYHDEEWGRPVTDERGLLERFCLEGFQSGLSWLTILRKRENFRAAFAGFDPDRVARFGKRDVERLLLDAGIVRHRAKQVRPVPKSLRDLPATTSESNALAKQLKRAGFRFVGPTTVYAAMQACGVVNDHIASCFVRTEVQREIDAAF